MAWSRISRCLNLTLLLCLYFSLNYAQLENTLKPEVKIPQGTLLGTFLTTRKGRNIAAFLRIPYGQPPIGNLRFANPVAANGWNGTLDASVEASKCAQPGPDGIVGEEDCLYLKVHTPQLPEDGNSSLLPVMVYIHGGAFRTESPAYHGPEYLLDADVLLVTMNYRLGPLGFLSTGDEVASGNWGLKDQILGLKWVRDNVRYFGGDPDQVTLFGESAGAASTHLLTLVNATNGLFHRYIMQSGSAVSRWAYRPRAYYKRVAFKFGEHFGCSNDTSSSLISCLRKVSVSDIEAVDLQLMAWGTAPTVLWSPTDEPDIDGAVLTDSPTNLFSAGVARDLPSMSGVVRDEGLFYTIELYKKEELLDYFLAKIDTLLPMMLFWSDLSDSGAALANASISYYFNNNLTLNASEFIGNLTLLVGDTLIFYPAYKILRQQYILGSSPQYFYTFNYRGTESLSFPTSGSTVDHGVMHGDELIYLFPMDSLFSDFNKTMSEKDYKMVDTMVQLWTSFAINGTPTASALGDGITWDPYTINDDKFLCIGNGSDVVLEVQSSFLSKRMQFWANLEFNSST